MGRVFFFIGEGMRALRRSPAPAVAAVVTVAVTVLLVGVLIPVLQTTNGKTNEVRDQVGLRIFLKDVNSSGTPIDSGNGQEPPQAQVQALKAKLAAIPHVTNVTYVNKQQALDNLTERLKEQNAEDI